MYPRGLSRVRVYPWVSPGFANPNPNLGLPGVKIIWGKPRANLFGQSLDYLGVRTGFAPGREKTKPGGKPGGKHHIFKGFALGLL